MNKKETITKFDNLQPHVKAEIVYNFHVNIIGQKSTDFMKLSLFSKIKNFNEQNLLTADNVQQSFLFASCFKSWLEDNIESELELIESK